MSDEIHEKVTSKVHSNIRKEAKELIEKVSEGLIRSFVDRGFRDKDVRPAVRDGLYDANFGLKK